MCGYRITAFVLVLLSNNGQKFRWHGQKKQSLFSKPRFILCCFCATLENLCPHNPIIERFLSTHTNTRTCAHPQLQTHTHLQTNIHLSTNTHALSHCNIKLFFFCFPSTHSRQTAFLLCSLSLCRIISFCPSLHFILSFSTFFHFLYDPYSLSLSLFAFLSLYLSLSLCPSFCFSWARSRRKAATSFPKSFDKNHRRLKTWARSSHSKNPN